MKPLIKVILIIGVILSSMMVALKLTGVLTVDQIEGWLNQAKEISPVYVALIIIALLSADLIIAVPTLTVSILAGYFLGFGYGGLTVIVGLMIAGNSGYFLSRSFGSKILGFLIRKPEEREEAKTAFQKHGFVLIMLSRAVPVLPEATACLSGMTKLRYPVFLLAWSINTIPYALITTYAGSVSSIDNPGPAIITAIAITGFFWLTWYFFHRSTKVKVRKIEDAST